MENARFIFVTGGVVSGLGKGITAASLGRLLKQRGLKVAALKLDPYMNIDPGTMSPYQHGEVFVTDDGAETDLDLGHYERFIDENLNKYSSLTSGKVYWTVLEKERNGAFSGSTVQVIPHVTQEIKNFIYRGRENSKAEVLITEIGGTIGDIESQPYIEAIRQISLETGRENCLFIHVTLVPFLKASGEHKSKPTQHSVKQLQSMGINPNIIIARADEEINSSILEKISLFCNVKPDCVIENITLSSLYEAPLELHAKGFDRVVCRELGLNLPEADLSAWQSMVEKISARKKEVCIAIVGKYVKLLDAYLSIIESLNHAGFEAGVFVRMVFIDSEEINLRGAESLLQGVEGIIIPGGFGDRGIEGKIETCRYARVNNIPFLGICLGMQVAVIEFARNVCNLNDAHSAEFNADTANPVIHLMNGQEGKLLTGGTMRLGAYPCVIAGNSRLNAIYGQNEISERHRHRFEFNNSYRELFIKNGLNLCGTSPDGSLVEAVELNEHKFFVGVQFHPEFKSRPNRPHPLFLGLLNTVISSHSDNRSK